jgi:hypothetical protein
MAVYNGKNIKGSIGNVSFTPKGAIHIVRIKPGKGGVKQTAATKRSAALFGKLISPFSKLIRNSFFPITNGMHDGTMVNRMNSSISSVIYQHREDDGSFNFNADSFLRLRGFNFNIHSSLDKSLLFPIQILEKDREMSVLFPEFNISKNFKFPKKSRSCVLSLQIAHFHLSSGKYRIFTPEKLIINSNATVQHAVTFNYPIIKGSLCLAGISLLYENDSGPFQVNHKGFHPSAIISASFYSGDAKKEDLKHWSDSKIMIQ